MNPPTTGYYSLVQYAPDRSRFEAANVGVLLFVPSVGFLRARLASGNGRIRRFFGHEAGDLEQVKMMKQMLEHAVDAEAHSIRTLDELKDFASRFANELFITEPRPARVEDPEVELAQLFDELVGGPVRRDPPPSSGILESLKRRLETPDLAGKVQQGTKANIPVIGKELVADFSFQNGRLNLIQAKEFDHQRLSDVMRETYKLAVDGHLLYKHPDADGQERQLVIVGSLGAETVHRRRTIEDLLRDHDVSFFGEDSLDDLVEKIRQTAHAAGEAAPR